MLEEPSGKNKLCHLELNTTHKNHLNIKKHSALCKILFTWNSSECKINLWPQKSRWVLPGDCSVQSFGFIRKQGIWGSNRNVLNLNYHGYIFYIFVKIHPGTLTIYKLFQKSWPSQYITTELSNKSGNGIPKYWTLLSLGQWEPADTGPFCFPQSTVQVVWFSVDAMTVVCVLT